MNGLDVINHCDLLLKLVKICNDGSVKPYDSAQVIKNLGRLHAVDKDVVDEVMKCCPPSAEVRDAKDLLPYRNAALKKLEELLSLHVHTYERRI